MADCGKFITVEGIDGSGKSTFIPKIREMFEALGESVVLTREPGGTPLGEALREKILLDKMDSKTELLLAFAARNEHLEQVIRPALEAGKVVVSDRFTDSTYAYQGYAKGQSLSEIKKLEELVQGGDKPALTLIFTVPVEVSRQRLDGTGKEPDKFESQGGDFFQRAIDGYADLAAADPERCKLIDSSKGLEHTERQVMEILSDFVSKLECCGSKRKSKP